MQSSKVRIFLEVISTNPTDSATIEASGGDRIELVSALEIGGVTPSAAIVRKSLEASSIPTHVIVRHHNNGFIHSQPEINLLLDDIIQLRDRFQVHGVVVGGIKTHGSQLVVDDLLMQMVMKECKGKTKVTFHKASDQTSSLPRTVQTLAQMGVDEVLTQGGKGSALSSSSIDAIKQINEQLRISRILAGGGITHSNVGSIVREWGVNKVHIGTCVRKDKYGLVDGESVAEFRKILDNLEL